MWNKNKSNRRKINIYTRKWFKIYLKVVSLISVCASRFKYNSSHAYSPIAEKKTQTTVNEKNHKFLYICVKLFEINIQSGLVLPDISLGVFFRETSWVVCEKGSYFDVDKKWFRDLYRSILMGEKQHCRQTPISDKCRKLFLKPQLLFELYFLLWVSRSAL